MRHTYLTHAESKTLLPSIRVTIGVGDDQIMFRVSDQGMRNAFNIMLILCILYM